MLSVAVLHILHYLYWITSNYGVSTLSLDNGGSFRQPILTHHLEATTGMITFFVLLCVSASRLSLSHCLLFILIAVASDSCRCPGCVRLSLALRAYVEFCALRTLR